MKNIGYVLIILAVVFAFWAWWNAHWFKSLAIIAIILSVIAIILILFNDKEKIKYNDKKDITELYDREVAGGITTDSI